MRSFSSKVVGVLTVVIVVGLAAWFGTRGKPANPNIEEPAATSTEGGAWKTYRNEKFGFEFEYPENLSPNIQDQQSPSFSGDGVIVNVDADAWYRDDFNSSSGCGAGAFVGSVFLKKIMIAKRLVLLCASYSELPRGVGSTDYVVLIPKNTADRDSEKNFIEIDLYGEDALLAPRHLETFEKLIDTFKFL